MKSSSCSIKQGKTILNYISFENVLGRGAFGEVWQVYNKRDSKRYACKVEEKSANHNLLSNEIQILQKLQDSPFFPKIQLFGSDSKNIYLIMDLYSQDLENYRWRNRGSITSTIVMQIALQMIEILESEKLFNLQDLHERGVLHRDIKPENIAIKDSDPEKVFLFDFGLSKQYIKSDGRHYRCDQNKGLIGTIRYASANALCGITQGRRDDLESLFYTLMFLLKGSLPWMTQYPTKQIKRADTLVQKANLKPEKIFDWNDVNQEFFQLFYYTRTLNFSDKPDYFYLKSLFKGKKLSYFSNSSVDLMIEEITSEDKRNRFNLQTTCLLSQIQLSSNHMEQDSENISEADEGFIQESQVLKINSEVCIIRKPDSR